MKHWKLTRRFLPLLGGLALGLLACQPAKSNLIGMDHEDWARTTYTRLSYPIPGHLDHLREIYINPVADGVVITLENGRRHYAYPAGTVVVKEIFATASPAPGEGPVTLVGMVKAPDDPRALGGWLWVVRDLKSGTETIGNQELCFTCHKNANEGYPYGDRNRDGEFRDFLFYPWDPARPPVRDVGSP